MACDAALAMWWDMAPAMRDAFEHWHSHEHFPERLALPGFRRASRWADAGAGEGFFVLYELATYEALTSPEYLARLNAPSDWSRRMMPHHRNMVRSQCRLLQARELLAAGGRQVQQRVQQVRREVREPAARPQVHAVNPHLTTAHPGDLRGGHHRALRSPYRHLPPWLRQADQSRAKVGGGLLEQRHQRLGRERGQLLDLGVERRHAGRQVAGLVTLGAHHRRQVGQTPAAQVEPLALSRTHREEGSAQQHHHGRRHPPDAAARGG